MHASQCRSLSRLGYSKPNAKSRKNLLIPSFSIHLHCSPFSCILPLKHLFFESKVLVEFEDALLPLFDSVFIMELNYALVPVFEPLLLSSYDFTLFREAIIETVITLRVTANRAIDNTMSEKKEDHKYQSPRM